LSITNPILGWIRTLGRTLTQTSLYSLEHPSVRRSIEIGFEELSGLLSRVDELVLHVSEGEFCAEGSPMEGLGPLSETLMELFTKYRLDSITFRKGATAQEYAAFLEVLTSRPEAIPEREGVQGLLLQLKVFHIECNTAVYAKIKKGETVSSAEKPDGADAAGATLEAEERRWIAEMEQMSLETALLSMIKKSVANKSDQQRIFERLMKQIQQDMENKVKEATLLLEQEKQKITFEKKRTEEVVSAAADGLIVVDAQGRIVMMNPAAERLYGVKLKERVGQDIREVLGEEQMVTLSKELADSSAGPATPGVDVKGVGETEKTLRASTALVQNQEGKVVGMVSTLSNATKAKELESMKRDFVANVSHELRTPLASVKQAITLVLDKAAGEVTAEQEKMLSLAQRNVERLTRLINDILDLSKIEAGKMVLQRAPHDLGEIVEEVGQTMTLFAQSRGVQMTFQVHKGLPKVDVDRDRVIQVLTNLVGNAVKFTPKEGKVTLNMADTRQGAALLSHLKVAVSDTGRGIAKEDLGKIFEKFVQVGGKSTDIRGTGLGLPITKALIEQHGGQIWVESELGKGSKFTLSLPVNKEKGAPPPPKPVAAAPAPKRSWFARLFSRG
jgi:PAS domain S-box-containing protein